MGYLRYPTLHDDTVVFVGEDDLWRVPVDGGRAWRLTAGVARFGHPQLSDDGSRIAFVGQQEGAEDVYVMPIEGGEPRRLTYDAANCTTVGWHGDEILYASNATLPFVRDFRLWGIHPDLGIGRRLPVGPARTISHGPTGGTVLGRHNGGDIVLGRHNAEPATWKRYRGGKAGTLWVDVDGEGRFSPLEVAGGNLASPCWVGQRIYFISDHQGVGNVYSTLPDGSDLQRHTDHDDFYVRGLSTDGVRLVYFAAGELYLLEPHARGPEPIPADLPSSLTQRRRRFVDAGEHLEHADPRPGGGDLAVVSRGKAFTLGCWHGPVRQHGQRDGVRYRLLTWLAGGEQLVAVTAGDTADENLTLLPADGVGDEEPLRDLEVGRPRELAANPTGALVALTNHRHELLLVDLTADGTVDHLDVSSHLPPRDLAWSPDGRWLAYARGIGLERSAIMVYDTQHGATHQISEPVLHDTCPAWDPEGRYLYFLGQRDFDPVHDQLRFDRSFPRGWRPYLVTLRRDAPAPFEPHRPEQPPEPVPSSSDALTDEAPSVDIDLDGITGRVVAFPVPEGRYERIAGIRGGAVFSSRPVQGSLGSTPFDTTPPADARLERFDFAKQRTETLYEGLSDFRVDATTTRTVLRIGDRLRVLAAGEKPPEPDEGHSNHESGWIDLDRIRLAVRPTDEWRQMFREAWRLQRDHFWDRGMAGIDWEEVYERYRPLLERVTTRSELSDLLWELHAELGTSHAYEIGGDHRELPEVGQGHLGVVWELDGQRPGAGIREISKGDVWTAATSPLRRPGIDVRPGDRVLTIDGLEVGGVDDGPVIHPGQALVGRAGEQVELTVVRRGGEPRRVTVTAVADDRTARYRDWVEHNRAWVHEHSDGRVGYLHIPDMGDAGFGEFHRSFLLEYDREALVVDVRFNGGGNVSPLLLERLARRRRGYAVPRHLVPMPWPAQSPRGPLVAVTNEYAGSDGDMFSHAFKLMGLGPLVGTRTWGGVVGISPGGRLADGTLTTQPEFYMTFDDIGWGLENRGAEPDVEVEVAPQEAAGDDDPQLDRALGIALERLDRQPPHEPLLPPAPRLARGPLPPRS